MTHPLQVLHVIPSVSLAHGGPSVALPLLARALDQAGVKVTIATTDDDGDAAHLDVPLGEPVRQTGATCYYFRRQTLFYKFSWPLKRWLVKHVKEFDAVHIHALFSFSSGAAARAATHAGVPYLVRPLGVLNRWGIKNRRRWLKQASLHFIELPILRHAAAIHYTSRREQEEAAAAHSEIGGFPSAIIPLAIDAAAYENLPDPSAFFVRHRIAPATPLVLFLSRIDEKKGLDLLLPAFAKISKRRPETILVIAGSGEPEYVATLRQRAAQLKISGQILWTGFLAGEAKREALAAATLFVLPSYSENFGIAAGEALAHGLPTILCDQVALADDVKEAEGGLVVKSDVDELAQAMERLLSNREEGARLGANAKKLIRDRFAPEEIAAELKRLYTKIIMNPLHHG